MTPFKPLKLYPEFPFAYPAVMYERWGIELFASEQANSVISSISSVVSNLFITAPLHHHEEGY